ncbi:replication protein A 70 kDa DNA-binding subunit B [Tanacetum coccineum]
MSRVPFKKSSNFGYQNSPTVGSSSFRSNNYRKDKGVVDASNITMIKDVDPMLENITVHGRCISLWHSHRLNEAHNPYSLDMVLQDSQNSKIQVYIKKEWMFRFEPLFKEGQCYSISNFAIAENSGRLPLLPHKYKISFYKGTVVTRIDDFDNNVNGFILEPFNRLLDGTRQYHEHEAVDIIGSVVAIGDVVPVQSAAGRKIRRTVVIEDSESNQLDCTFWDQWANMWDEYALKRDELGHVVFILQLGKVKYWDGTPLKELPEYDENQFKISLFTPQKPVVIISEFFNGAVKKMVSSIRECEHKSHCIVCAKIRMIHKENGWAYTGCKKCNKKVNVVDTKASSSAGKSKVTFYCEDHGAVQVASRYKVIMRIIDSSGSAPIVFFNTIVNKLSGYTAWELMERHDMDVDEYWPRELLDLVGKRMLFKLYYSDYNVNNNNHTYRCDAVSDDPAMIKHFKDGFLDEEDDGEEFVTPLNQVKGSGGTSGTSSRRLKHTNNNDSDINRVINMDTPNKEDKGLGSGGSSGIKRVFIDLDDIESDEDEGGISYKTPKLVAVKLEKEDT